MLIRAIHATNLNETTCIVLFTLIEHLEDYKAIAKNLNQYTILLNLFSFIEKVLVFNWKVCLLDQHSTRRIFPDEGVVLPQGEAVR